MAGINFVRRWVMGQMTKKADDGIMITLPDSSKVDLNVSITMDRLIRNGIDPDQITSPQQVENALNMIDSRMVNRAIPADSTEGREITEKIFGKQKAPVFDLEGNRIPEGSGIMGGKAVKELMDSGQVSKGARGMKKSKKVEDREMFQNSNLNKKAETSIDQESFLQRIKKAVDEDREIKARLDADNKKGIANIKNKRQLTDDEIRDYEAELGDSETWMMDGTVGEAETALKNQKAYMADMELEYRKGNLDPEPGSGTSQRKRFLQKKLEEAEASGDARLMSREEREELFDLDDIPEYATGGRIGYKSGNSVLDQALAAASVPYNFGKGIIGNVSNPGAVTDVSLTGAQTDFLDSIAKSKGPSGNIDYSDYGGLTKTFSGISGMNPMQASLATTMGGTGYNTNTDGSINYTGGAYDFNKGNVVTDFIDKGGILGAVDKLGDGAIGKFGASIYDAVNPEEDYDFSDIEGQTAGLGVASFLVDKFGPKIGAAIFKAGKNKAKNYVGKKIVKPQIDKAINKIKNKNKKTTTNSGSDRGGGDVGGNKNVGGGNTAKNSQGQTASQATSAGTGTSQGYSQHYADGGITRANFVGGGMGRRGFLKLLGSLGAGAAAIKTGILGLGGKQAGKEVAKEVVKQSAGTPPPYFFKLVEKIKTLGDNSPKLAVKDREVVTKYKDYTLTEDITTGEKTIQRMKIDDDLKYDASEYYGKPVGEEVYMSYKPGKGQADETMKGKTPPDEYTEDTSLIRSDRPAEGEVMDTFDGVPDDILKEVEAGSGNVPESFYTGSNPIKKASGGLAYMLGE